MKKAVWLLIILLAACAAPATRDDLGADEARAGASVGLLPLNLQQGLEAKVFENPLGFAGTAGRVTVFKGEETRQRRLRAALTGVGFDFKQQISSLTLGRLSEAGVDIQSVRFRRSIDNILEEVPPGRFEKRPPADTGKDYILDIHVDLVGYIAAKLTDSYLPTLHVGARLLNGSDLTEVYRTRIEYNPLDAEESTVALTADEQYQFKDSEAMQADPQRAAAGLQAAIDAVLAQIQKDLVGLARS